MLLEDDFSWFQQFHFLHLSYVTPGVITSFCVNFHVILIIKCDFSDVIFIKFYKIF